MRQPVDGLLRDMKHKSREENDHGKTLLNG